MTKQDVVEPEAKQLLRCQQRHASLLRRTISFSLIALHARRNEVLRCALAALCTGKDVIQSQVFGMPVFTAVLAAVTVADVYPSPLHRCLTIVASEVDIVAQPDDRGDRKRRRRRMKNIRAVIFLNEDRSAKPKANSTRYAHRSERLVGKIQK